MPEVTTTHPVPADLLARAHALIAAGGRHLIGIAGAPGAGKSTLAAQLVEALGPRAVLVPMDGYHLADDELHRLRLHHCKGALDTFDVGGYLALLRRMRAADEPVVYAPVFDRALEAAVAGSIRVPQTTPLVVTEGNYLLVDDGPWAGVRALLDQVWFVEVPETVRLERLTARHRRFGRSAEDAAARARGSDQVNAELIAATRGRADLVVTLG